MFECSLDPPAPNAPARMRRMLCRITAWEPRVHLQLMREADLWSKACFLSGERACNVVGSRGDLFFILKTFEIFFQTSTVFFIHRLWNVNLMPQLRM